MILSQHETERFYHIWWPLLSYVNDRRQIGAKLPTSPQAGPITPEEADKVRRVLWEEDALRTAFIAENPANLLAEDLAIVASWQYRITGNFYILRYLKKHTIFISQGSPAHAYGVLGLVSPIEDVIPWPLPVMVSATLLPFGNKITYDGMLGFYSLMFGPGIRSSLSDAYRTAKEREGIITSLPPEKQFASLDELRKHLAARNEKILEMFRKRLAQTNLSFKMIEEHTNTIATFAEVYLLALDPPRGLLDVTLDDVQEHLQQTKTKGLAISFKRFVRFLFDTDRMNNDAAWELLDALKKYAQ